MRPKSLAFFTLVLIVAVTLIAFKKDPLIPETAVLNGGRVETFMPFQTGFGVFAATVRDGQAGVVRGVYVAGVLALPVRQQPVDKPAFVWSVANEATQFRLAADWGTIGLLAHNYLAGKLFFNLAEGQEVLIVYGDGAVKRYVVSAIYRYQAIAPNDIRTGLVDLETGQSFSAADVFYQVYSGGDRVTFQTCIAKSGNLSWGRFFVVAMPVSK